MAFLTRRTLLGTATVGLAGVGVWYWQRAQARAAAAALYESALVPPKGPMRVFHLGHSLVGRDMPAFLAQLAGEGHGYESQLGWGTPLHDHWEPDAPVNGFDAENDHPRFRPAADAIGSGEYDAVILTEMVELRDAIRYFDSPTYLARWAKLATEANPDTRIYLYETWHPLDDPKGWLDRLDADLPDLWEAQLALPAAARTGNPIWIIPAGQAMAAFAREIEVNGGIGNIRSREDLFARSADGTQDQIHMSDLGAYLVALTHFATLYHRSPVGLPLALTRADGTAANAPDPQAGARMQQVVWDVVRGYAKSGVSA